MGKTNWRDLYCEEDPAWLDNIMRLMQCKSANKYALLEHFAYVMSQFLDHIECLQEECESPIERAFFDAVINEAPCHGLPVEHEPHRLQDAEQGKFTWGLYLKPQFELTLSKKYRADFLLVTVDRRSNSPRKMIVECDGHEFHDRTKEQAARDKSRDREMIAAGYTVMRFTGSEIHKDAKGCAEQVCHFLSRYR